MKRLEGKSVIITGANSGVGKAAALLFASEGAKLMLCARRENKLKEVEDEIRAAGGTVQIMRVDVSVADDARKVTAACAKAYGGIDVLVNNAGIITKTLYSVDKCQDDEEFDKVLGVNVKGPFFMIREALAYMIPAQKGSIVNVASVAGTAGMGDARYVASKGAVLALTKHTAIMHNSRGIRCNAICPATILTPMITEMTADSIDPDAIAAMNSHAYVDATPNQPEDIAKTLLFLASDDSKNITGQSIICDFGYTL